MRRATPPFGKNLGQELWSDTIVARLREMHACKNCHCLMGWNELVNDARRVFRIDKVLTP